MALSAFDDKSHEPRAGELDRTLGRTSAHWKSLTAHLASQYAPLEQAWNFAGAKWGWSLRSRHKKRTVLYMTPCRGTFLVGFVLGERACEAARASGLPDSVIELIDGARKYAEGRGLRIEVRSKKDLAIVEKLAALKMAN